LTIDHDVANTDNLNSLVLPPINATQSHARLEQELPQVDDKESEKSVKSPEG